MNPKIINTILKKKIKKLNKLSKKIKEERKKVDEIAKPILAKLNKLPRKEREDLFIGLMTTLYLETKLDTMVKMGVMSAIPMTEVATCARGSAIPIDLEIKLLSTLSKLSTKIKKLK